MSIQHKNKSAGWSDVLLNMVVDTLGDESMERQGHYKEERGTQRRRACELAVIFKCGKPRRQVWYLGGLAENLIDILRIRARTFCIVA